MKVLRAWIIAALALGASVFAAAGAAQAQSASPTFEQVLAAPDDVDQNLRYAHERADAGRLLESAAALERVLISRPNASDVRLLYVSVLYRLDDLQDAAAQLALIDPAGLTPAQRAEAGRYRDLVAHRHAHGVRGLSLSGELAAGVAYDSDAAGALLTQVVPIFWWQPPVVKQSGAGAVYSGHLDASLPVGPEGLSLQGSVSGYDRTRVSGGKDDFWVGGARAGAVYGRGRGSVGAFVVGRTYSLEHSHYLDETGARIEGRWRLRPNLEVSLAAEGVRQKFATPLFAGFIFPMGFTTITADGDRYDTEASVSWRPNPRVAAGVTAGFERKTSSYKPYAYTSPYVQGGVSLGLDRGVYANIAGDWRVIDYAAYDYLFTRVKRHNDRGLARVALGVPLSAFCSHGGDDCAPRNIAIEASATYVTRTDRSRIAAYRDTGAELRLIWRFGNR